MTSRRVQKVAQAIREVIAMAVIADLKDPRVRNVTVTFVEVSGDLRSAKVHVSVMGDDTQQRLSLAGLKSAAGFLQSKVGDRIDTRYTPRLEFVLDMGVKKSLEIARLLKQVLPPEAETTVESVRPLDESLEAEAAAMRGDGDGDIGDMGDGGPDDPVAEDADAQDYDDEEADDEEDDDEDFLADDDDEDETDDGHSSLPPR